MTIDIYETINNNIYNFPKKLPYITVSSKGISNGLSTIINDGADFGPDTLLGTSSKNRYGPPYSQTSGIQEAINYCQATGANHIHLNKGIYIINWNDTFTKQQYAIGIPSLPNGLSITGEGGGNLGMPFVLASNSPYGSGGSVYTTLNGTIIYFNFPNTSFTNTYTTYPVFGLYVLPSPDIYDNKSITQVFIDNVDFSSNLLQAKYGWVVADFENASSLQIGHTNIWTDLPQATYLGPTPPTPSTFYFTIGLITPSTPTIGMPGHVQIYVSGFQTGIVINGSHQSILNLFIQACNNAIELSPFVHTAIINYLAVSMVQYVIYFTPPNSSYETGIIINDLDTEIGSNLSIPLKALIYNPQNAYIQGKIRIHNVNNGLTLSELGTIPNGMEIEFNGVTTDVVNNLFQQTVNGTTAGSVFVNQLKYSTYYKKVMFVFNDYENDTTTNQTISYPMPFNTIASITSNTTNLTITASTSGITITSPNSTATYNGIVIVEGY